MGQKRRGGQPCYLPGFPQERTLSATSLPTESNRGLRDIDCHVDFPECAEIASMTTAPIRPFQVARNSDRHALHRDVGIGALLFKVTTADSNGALLVVEIVHHAKGGPPRHLHRDQDEWFHVIEGEYLVEIGERAVLAESGRLRVRTAWGTTLLDKRKPRSGTNYLRVYACRSSRGVLLGNYQWECDGTNGPSFLATI